MLVEGPDFICIGLPKAATGWLYDQLQFHPDIWMPPIKELGYLNHEITRFNGSEQRLSRLEEGSVEKGPSGDRVRRKHLTQKRRSRERDLGFLRAASRLRGQPRALARYKELFSVKGDLLSGDITPGYCRLEEDMIAQIAAELPSAKILLLVRDPVSRTWSELSMANRKGNFDEGVLEDPDAFRALLDKRRKSQIPSRPTAVLERWKRYYPPERFRCILFDDIGTNPTQTLEQILRYIGADPSKKGIEVAADFNRKSVRKKLQMNSPVRAMLVDYFADEIRACAQAFGGAAADWPAKYGL